MWRFIWVEFMWVIYPVSRGFFSGWSGFPLSQKSKHLSNIKKCVIVSEEIDRVDLFVYALNTLNPREKHITQNTATDTFGLITDTGKHIIIWGPWVKIAINIGGIYTPVAQYFRFFNQTNSFYLEKLCRFIGSCPSCMRVLELL